MRNARARSCIGAIAGKASPYERVTTGDARLFGDESRYEATAIRALAGDVGGLDVVDIGSADTEHAAWLREHGARVVHVDPRAQDLREPLPLQKEAFDLVFSSLTLHSVLEWEPVLREFRRIAKPNGALVFSTYHPCRGLHDGLGVDYFSTGRVVDRCGAPGDEMQESYWRRPLQAIVGAVIDTGWRIAKISEPRIAEAVDPCFLIVRATR